MLHIKQNDYKQPTESREEVVQMICDCFLQGCSKEYHAGTHTLPIEKEVYVAESTLSGKNGTDYFFLGQYETHSKYAKTPIRLRSCEVDEAIKALTAAGYHIYKYYWQRHFHLKCSEKVLSPDTHEDYWEVTEFNTNID